MKHTILSIFLIFFSFSILHSQDEIFQVVEEMPRFPGCEEMEATNAEKKKCADTKFLEYIYSNIQYPQEAIVNNLEGTVVVQFIIEKDGSVSSPKILKDIGGGCGEETVRILNQMNEQGIKWIAGKQAGIPERVQFSFPVKFKLEDPKDYYMLGQDTVYTNVEKAAIFKGGMHALDSFFIENLKYPSNYQDSCWIGHMDVSFYVLQNEAIYIDNFIDYCGLGIDFEFEAIKTLNASSGKWTPATYNGRNVNSAYTTRIFFNPPEATCKTEIDNYSQALLLAVEASQLSENEDSATALEKLNEAINLNPKNAEFYYSRAVLKMQSEQYTEACEDIQIAKELTGGEATSMDEIMRLICR